MLTKVGMRVALLVPLLSVGCRLAAVMGGCGDLPVKYQVCDGAHQECKTVARFNDFHACERLNRLDAALCDSLSQPGKIVCDTTYISPIASGHCTY